MLQKAVQIIEKDEDDSFIPRQMALSKTLARPLENVDAFTMVEFQRIAGSIDDIRGKLGLLLE